METTSAEHVFLANLQQQLDTGKINEEQAKRIIEQFKLNQLKNNEKNQQLARQEHLQNRYNQLLKVIDELGRDIRPAYAGSRGAPERLKKGIHTARSIVRECLSELERVSKDQ